MWRKSERVKEDMVQRSVKCLNTPEYFRSTGQKMQKKCK
jgi:hypothetical protein